MIVVKKKPTPPPAGKCPVCLSPWHNRRVWYCMG